MISHRGGELWVWTSPMGEGAAMIRTSTKAQPDRRFERVKRDGIVLWFEAGIAIDDVKIGWMPFTGFDVTWPGTLSLIDPAGGTWS
jgi:hypothetical protein